MSPSKPCFRKVMILLLISNGKNVLNLTISGRNSANILQVIVELRVIGSCCSNVRFSVWKVAKLISVQIKPLISF